MARTNPGGAQSSPVPPEDGQQESLNLDSQIEEADTTESNEEFEPYVEWQGAVTYREITKEHWQQAGVHDQETVTFSRDNRRVPLASLSEDAQNRLADEPDFHFVTEPPKEDD